MLDNKRAELVSLEQSREIMRIYHVTDVISLGGLELISYVVDQPVSSGERGWRKSKWKLPGQTNVPIAAAITSYSRMIINQIKLDAQKEGLDIFYSDTDSIVLNGPLPENLNPV